MNNTSVEKFLLSDRDNYVKNMSKIDLYARKVKTHDEYLQKISKLAMSFNLEEKEKLYRCTKMADSFFNKYITDDIYGKDIAKIEWIFALVNNNKDNKDKDNSYEEGLPHTRTNIIFLSKYVLNNDELNLTNVLIHEKVHIYQRYNNMEEIIKNMGYEISRTNNKIDKLRANPDINNNVYYDIKNNMELLGLYKSNTPSGINDVIITNFSTEHPYEKMAYNIAEEYNKTHINKYKNNNLL